MTPNLKGLKREMVATGRRLWERGFVVSHDGNISVRIGANDLLTTPTGVSKGAMTASMIIRVDLEGKILDKGCRYRPSSELKMHLKVYRDRPDVNAVIHAHPVFCTSFAVAGIPLDRCVLPEAAMNLGAVLIAPYATPSTNEVPDSIGPFIRNSDAVLLANHGAITLGPDIMTAFRRMETLEQSAQVTFQALQLGNLNTLPAGEFARLMELRSKMGIPGRIRPLTG